MNCPTSTPWRSRPISGPQQVNFCRFPADYLILVVPPKTHNIFPVSLSIPNLVGFVKPEQRVLMFGASAQEMKRINFSQSDKYFQLVQFANRNFVALLKQIPPSLVLIDGLYGMEGKGPIKGSPVFHGFAIASEDAVAADALATHVMGFSPDDVPYLDMAFHEGLGNNRWQNVIGSDPAAGEVPLPAPSAFPEAAQARGAGRRERAPQGGRSSMKESLKQKIKALKTGRDLRERAILLSGQFPLQRRAALKLDFHRKLRRGIPEVIFGQGKSVEQLRRIVEEIHRNGRGPADHPHRRRALCRVAAGVPRSALSRRRAHHHLRRGPSRCQQGEDPGPVGRRLRRKGCRGGVRLLPDTWGTGPTRSTTWASPAWLASWA